MTRKDLELPSGTNQTVRLQLGRALFGVWEGETLRGRDPFPYGKRYSYGSGVGIGVPGNFSVEDCGNIKWSQPQLSSKFLTQITVESGERTRSHCHIVIICIYDSFMVFNKQPVVFVAAVPDNRLSKGREDLCWWFSWLNCIDILGSMSARRSAQVLKILDTSSGKFVVWLCGLDMVGYSPNSVVTLGVLTVMVKGRGG